MVPIQQSINLIADTELGTGTTFLLFRTIFRFFLVVFVLLLPISRFSFQATVNPYSMSERVIGPHD